ncbi:complex I NDUFA9 subunit family protein [Pseudophaeobacter sp.]|uniref:complex I NDUFA9 subunit family protein n=1 Tax=Pseudophaeobacter sp. TaxID=1971739 RepID=UPI0032995BF3
MSKLVTIYGGSGFVGRYIARRMAKEGWRVRVAVRRPNEAMHVKPYGVPGQVEPVLCNIRDDASVAAAMHGADAVVNCVGVLNEHGKNTFASVQIEGAARIARFAHKQGIAQMVHVSALGADASEDASAYAQTKAKGEEAVQGYFPNAVILRPSVIFGTEDQFFNRFAGMARLSPVLPIAKGKTLFQPVYVDDVARAAVKGILGEASPGIYELGGPEVKSFAALMQEMLGVIHRRRLVLSLPGFAAWLTAFGFDMMQAISLQLIENKVLTRDQLKSLGSDNVVSEGARGFADLGITPEFLGPILPSYLWKFRPSGQYDEMTASARNLKGDA